MVVMVQHRLETVNQMQNGSLEFGELGSGWLGQVKVLKRSVLL